MCKILRNSYKMVAVRRREEAMKPDESQVKPEQSKPGNYRQTAFQLIMLLGVVSMFGDIAYEGGRSISGPYLATLGASAAVVGLVTGAGEFLGYALRLLSGYLADRTKAYWLLTFIGYGLIGAIPLLAFAGNWQLAALLLILERIGKAIRSPARDTIISYAGKNIGRGWGFAIHEAMDQVGAIIGPLVLSFALITSGGYRRGFNLLWIPVVLCLAALIIANRKAPVPERLEAKVETDKQKAKGGLGRVFWLYGIFVLLAGTGFASFQLIAYHVKAQAIISDARIPILYAIAMGVDAVVALIIGKSYDKWGLMVLFTIPALTLPIPFLGFSHTYWQIILAIVLWGAVMGIHETIMRAAIADLVPIERRGSAYGIFNTLYGLSLFLGSAAMGFLYEVSATYIMVFAVVMELVSIPALFLIRRSRS
ncbi:MAG: MFS transporter [Acidobacteriota bacterium]|nr:MFS transporter [Acidobacteriota bacterium]